MIAEFARDKVTILRPSLKTMRGSEVFDYTNATEHEERECSVQPASTSVDINGRVLGISDGLTIYLPSNADVKASDHVRYNGEEYYIEGEPRRWTSPSGNCSNIQIACMRWVG